MPKVFISYARSDLSRAQELEQALRAHGVSVWRDQHDLYGGDRWPKKLGEAIADCDAVLLLWSAHSADRPAVEFEWCTAIALEKQIIPLMLDQTPLHPSLRAFNWIKEPDTDGAVVRILQALPAAATPTDNALKNQVITKLASIKAVEEVEVLAQAKMLFNQTDRHHVLLFIVASVVVVIVVLAAFYFMSRAFQPPQPVPSPTVEEMTKLTGQVEDERGNPLPGAIVRVDEITGRAEPMWGTTTSSGGFIIVKIPARIGDRVRVYVSKEGYTQYDQYVALPGPLPTVKLRRKK